MKHTPIAKISPKQKVELNRRMVVRSYLLTRYGNKCAKCGERPDFRGLSLSHKKPLARGGATTVENCELLCGKCHSGEHNIKEN